MRFLGFFLWNASVARNRFNQKWFQEVQWVMLVIRFSMVNLWETLFENWFALIWVVNKFVEPEIWLKWYYTEFHTNLMQGRVCLKYFSKKIEFTRMVLNHPIILKLQHFYFEVRYRLLVLVSKTPVVFFSDVLVLIGTFSRNRKGGDLCRGIQHLKKNYTQIIFAEMWSLN